MTTKPKSPKKPPARIDLEQIAEDALALACREQDLRSIPAVLDEVANALLSPDGWFDKQAAFGRWCVQFVRDRIASGRLVKAGGKYRWEFIGGPGGLE